MTIYDRLLATVGGMERFEWSFDQRTFSPERRAREAIDGGVQDAEAGLGELSAAGCSPEMAEQWLAQFIAKWAKYQHAGARTLNWMITGPARFPVERNRKHMEVEHKRSVELSEHVSAAANWAHRRMLRADRAELVATDEGGHQEKVVAGVRCVLNKTLNRVQLVFPGRPEPEIVGELKARAFRWAPSLGVWQRQLTQNGIWAAEYVLKKLASSGDPS